MGERSSGKKLRILLWAAHGAGTHYWGPGTSAYRLYESAATKKNFEITLVHGSKNQGIHALYKRQYFLSDLEKKSIGQTIIFLLRSWFWIKKHHKEFDVVHVLGAYHYSFMPALWLEKYGVRAFIKMTTINSGLTNSSRLSKFLGLDRYRRNHVDQVSGFIAISTAIANELREVGVDEKRIQFIPNGVDTETFKPAKSKELARKAIGLGNMPTVLFTGSITARKNPLLLARSFVALSLDAQLLIVGPPREDSDELEKIEYFLKEVHKANVHMIPYTEDIRDYYQASDIFVLPSTNEGLSNSLLEAQSSGLPALVTRISGSEDVVEPGINGDFVETTEASLKAKLAFYLGSMEEMAIQGRNAREIMVKHYERSKVLDSHLHLFKSMINQSDAIS